MDSHPLEYITEPYDASTLENILVQFRDLGYARLPDVFVRDSVDLYRTELEKIVYDNGLELKVRDDSPLHISPALAPRIRQVVTPALSHSVSAYPLPSLYTSIWVVQPQDRPAVVPGWHKDREPDGMPGKEYHYPRDVFVGMYFEDMTDEGGPTCLIPGSHRDVTLTPYMDLPVEPIVCRKQDVYLLDQRAWHRGKPRTVPGTRIVAVYGYFPVPAHYSRPLNMPRAQRTAWHAATTLRDKALLGGIFEPPTDDER